MIESLDGRALMVLFLDARHCCLSFVLCLVVVPNYFLRKATWTFRFDTCIKFCKTFMRVDLARLIYIESVVFFDLLQYLVCSSTLSVSY